MVLRKVFKKVMWLSIPQRLTKSKVSSFQDKSAIIIFAFSLLPFFILSFYNSPKLDDFVFASWSNKMGFIEYMKFLLTNENGRFSALALLYFIPDPKFSLVLYKVYPIFILIFFIFSFFIFIKTFFKTSNTDRWLIVLGIAACYLNSMPSLYEGIYWITGSITHFLPLIFILWIFISLKRFLTNEVSKIKKALWIFGLILQVFFIVAFDEIILIFTICFFSFILLMSLVLGLKGKKIFFLLLMISIIGGTAVLLCPGTLLRASSTNSDKVFNIGLTIKGSVYWGSIFIFKLIFKNPLTYFIVFLFLRRRNTVQLQFNVLPIVSPIYLLLISYSLILLLFFPGMFSMIGTYPRMLNVILFLSVFILAYNLLNLKMYSKNCYSYQAPRVFKYVPLVVSLFILVNGNQARAFKDVFDNNPQKQSLEFSAERARLYLNENNIIAVLKNSVSEKNERSHNISGCAW